MIYLTITDVLGNRYLHPCLDKKELNIFLDFVEKGLMYSLCRFGMDKLVFVNLSQVVTIEYYEKNTDNNSSNEKL